MTFSELLNIRGKILKYLLFRVPTLSVKFLKIHSTGLLNPPKYP